MEPAGGAPPETSPVPPVPPTPPVTPQMPQKTSMTPLVVIALVVFLLGLGGVYAVSNAQTQSVKREVTSLKAQAAKQASTLRGSIDNSVYQAVFLTSGQVYFGKLSLLNTQYVTLTNIYYLQGAGDGKNVQELEKNIATTQGNVSLVKLGCELHGPKDQMTINQDKITFWENLKTDGKVSKAIHTYEQQNPAGQKCS
jgi:hypothetical protein